MLRDFSKRKTRSDRLCRRLALEPLEPRTLLSADSVVTINEIMYHPADDEGLEWIELTNQMAVDIDLSGWRLDGAVDFSFPKGTVLGGREYLVVAASPELLQEKTEFAGALGPYTGRLDNGGEEIVLRDNNDRLMDEVRYNDNEPWPIAPDGYGPSLAKIDPLTPSGPAENWAAALEVGGTPGAINFQNRDVVPFVPLDTKTIVELGAQWKVDASGTDPGPSWHEPQFDDNAWTPVTASAPSMLITEIGTGSPDYIEIQNVSGAAVDTTGWFVVANDAHTADGWHPDLWYLPTEPVTAGEILYRDDAGLDAEHFGDGIYWPSTGSGWVMIVDNLGNVVDFVAWGYDEQQILDLSLDVGPLEKITVGYGWLGDGIAKTETDSLFLQRTGDTDHNDASDWSFGASQSPGVGNDGLVLPVSLGTGIELRSSRTTDYFRTEFDFSDPVLQTELTLNVAVDDGIVLYLNGEEIYRQNMPEGLIGHDTPATVDVGTATLGTEIHVSMHTLRKGTNTLAMEVHQAAAGQPPAARTDTYVAAELNATIWPPEWRMANTFLALNEISAGGPSPLQIELANYGTESVDLGGYVIATSAGAEYVLPSGWLLAGGVRSFDAAELGFNASPGDTILFYLPDRTALVDAVRVETVARARQPDGDGPWLYPEELTIGRPNEIALHDEIVINEIMYHHPAQFEPYAEIGEEWIELYNRSEHEVDLSGWRLDDAIEFTFPAGTKLAAGEYLVVADNAAAMALKWPGINVLGDFSGGLSNDNERILLRDAYGNPADEVHYYDDAPWTRGADGNGSSLELIHPDIDNTVAEAWAPSDEAARSEWKHYSYTMTAVDPRFDPADRKDFPELRVGLLSDGEVLLDNISVIEKPGTAQARELIQNGTFGSDEPTADKWRLLGTHSHTTAIDDGGNMVMHLVATGPANYLNNLTETTLKSGSSYVSVVPGTEYQISFDAKWLTGTPQLHTELYYNKVVSTTILDMPTKHGTPGARNSTFVANPGPTYHDLTQSAAVPAAGEDVTVSVAASDPDGVESMTLWYSVTGGAWQETPMALDADGHYAGIIPGQTTARVVQFYVEGQDTVGAVSTYPAAGPDSRALIQFADNRSSSSLDNFRIIMTAADSNILHNGLNILSNDRLGATLVYNDEVFYDAGVRLRGSMWSRSNASTTGFNVKLPADQLFRGIHSTVTIKRRNNREILVKHMALTAGDVPSSYDDIVQLISHRSDNGGPARLSMSRYDDNIYLDSQFENGADGTMFKMEGVRVITQTSNGTVEGIKQPKQGIGWIYDYDLTDLGDDKEQYRWTTLINTNRDRDDYDAYIAMAQAFDLNGDALVEAVQQVIDVDQWMRVFALASLAGIGDTYTQGNPHNHNMYVRPEDGKVLALPWDWDFTFNRSSSSELWGNKNVGKIITQPVFRRIFFGHMLDLIDKSYNRAYMTRWMSHYGQMTGESYSSYLNYIQSRSTYVTGRINLYVPPVDFAITTNEGGDFTVDDDTATLEGTGWVDVREIRVPGRNVVPDVVWTSSDDWRVEVPLVPGENAITLEAYDFDGELIGSDSITVTSTLTERPVQDFLRIAEINYHPHDADTVAGELDVDDNEFEFVELLNTSTTEALDLTGVRLVQTDVGGDNEGIRFEFAAQTLTPGERIVVVGNRAAFESRYGNEVPIAAGNDAGGIDGEFGGRLANGGEMLTLLDTSGAVVQQFAYDDSGSWPGQADGWGSSLVVRDPSGDFADPGNWYASVETGGSPGTAGVEPAAQVVGRHVFYNNSAFDTTEDDAAIATDKEALLPNQTATFANYTSYDRGINGIIVDIADPTHTPVLADFAFRVGNNSDLSSWAAAPDPSSIEVRSGQGRQGSDRVAITWPDNAIRGQWLEVTVKATETTGLSEPDVFYFGNAPGEAGDNPTNTIVNATDEIAARNFPHSAVDTAPIDDPYDYNRDGLVDATDQIIARANQTNPLTRLRLITAPALNAGLRQAAEEDALAAEALSAALDWQEEYENTRSDDRKSRDFEATVDLLLATDWV